VLLQLTIPPGERDKELGDKMLKELPGILVWMLAGCMAWQKRGLDPPKIVTDATSAYLESEEKLADATRLMIHVHHYPPGASKWNRIEHRLFCHITQTWRGRPLTGTAKRIKPTPRSRRR
jgi:Rhodopirellula transposase DDE domain